MSSQKPLHAGPMLPLAIMALFALMIPVISIANSRNKVSDANAMKMRIPGNTPTPVRLEPTGTINSKATVKPTMKYSY